MNNSLKTTSDCNLQPTQIIGFCIDIYIYKLNDLHPLILKYQKQLKKRNMSVSVIGPYIKKLSDQHQHFNCSQQNLYMEHIPKVVFELSYSFLQW